MNSGESMAADLVAKGVLTHVREVCVDKPCGIDCLGLPAGIYFKERCVMCWRCEEQSVTAFSRFFMHANG